MDKTTSVIAALRAGKQPSQSQTNAWIEKLLSSELIQVEQTTGGGELNENGKKLARDLRTVLETFKTYGSHKNGDNLVQEALWHLGQADIASSSLDIDIPMDTGEALNDYRAIISALRISLQIFWDNATIEGCGVFSDFASFTRLSLADAAEVVGEKSSRAAEKLRTVEGEVQAGERDPIGFKEQTKEEWKNADAREAFEKGMDTAKVAGSATIGVTHSVSGKSTELKDRSRTRLQAAIRAMTKRAKEEPDYRQSLDTLFNLIQKWLKATGDLVADAAQSTSLASLINDPTPEKHLVSAIRCMDKLARNIANGKSLEDFYSVLRTCVIDIRNDVNLQRWVDDYLAYAKRTLAHVGENDPEDVMNTREDLLRRWSELTSSDSEKSRKWKDDFLALRGELRAFQECIEADKDLQAIRKAYAQLGRDFEETLLDAASVGVQSAISGASWLWSDLFNVYLPRFVCMLKSIPIPRTEYVDNKMEFVLEDLDISSVGLLPGQVFIRNIADIEISAPGNGTSTTAVGGLIQVHVKGLQFKLSELSFYYRDLTATITLPPEGVDLDIKVRMIPSTPTGLSERAERKRFLRVEHVGVNVSNDAEVRVTKSNHPVLLAMFRPLLTARLRGALQTTLSENIRSVLDGLDELAWDVIARAEVFEDAGYKRGPALAAAWWSELGRLRRTHGGLWAGWHLTGTGIVRESGKADVAFGAEPQVLTPEKHGPKGTLVQPLKERARDAGSMKSVEGTAKDVVGQARDGAKAGLQKARTFEEMITEKQKMEESKRGWMSSAFDDV
ncbi:hypothetical protein B0F90DRAFT_1812128 [Multifurca ochricompacta]|uniref:Uncharacterized protein n=1 Tax=Multifurca ochricompacta TaxID=376703 RepID=A0AAD4LVW0_9AGAM|nr:hypothetical protein B0F90DRAFT_1812128 [Multifurca ochricompacta]